MNTNETPETINPTTGMTEKDEKALKNAKRFTKALYVTTAVLVVGAIVEAYVSKKNNQD